MSGVGVALVLVSGYLLVVLLLRDVIRMTSSSCMWSHVGYWLIGVQFSSWSLMKHEWMEMSTRTCTGLQQQQSTSVSCSLLPVEHSIPSIHQRSRHDELSVYSLLRDITPQAQHRDSWMLVEGLARIPSQAHLDAAVRGTREVMGKQQGGLAQHSSSLAAVTETFRHTRLDPMH
jgi:hypothetical protein